MTWIRSHWRAVLAAAAFFLLGVGIGAAGSEPEHEDAEPARAAEATVTEQVTSTLTETVVETVDPTEAELAELESRSAELDDRAAGLRGRERKLVARERKVRRAEDVVARSQFEDGVYLVGKDVPAGSYVAPGGGGCYWARLERESQDILDNHFGSGQARATLRAGELFETQGCGRWRRG